MPISQGDMLFGLIQSLTKAEKRNFKLYIRRLQKEGEVKFYQLFAILEKWDTHQTHILYYKIAAIHLANGQPDLCVHYLQPIINASAHLRDDILIYARLLLFMAHFEMKNLEVLEYLLASASRLIQKSKERNRLQKLCLRHFKKLSTAGMYEQGEKLQVFLVELESLEANVFLRRAFLYLNVPLWVKSLLAKRSMAELSNMKKLSV